MRGFIAHKTAISWLLHAKSAALLLMGDFKQQYLHITHDTGKTRRFRNPYRATKVLRHGEIIIDFIKKYTSNTFMAPGLEVVTWGYGN